MGGGDEDGVVDVEVDKSWVLRYLCILRRWSLEMRRMISEMS